MKRFITTLNVVLALSISCSAAFAEPESNAEKGKEKETYTCPVTKEKFEKSKGIAVKTKSGKTVYVCCPGCVEAAKQLK
jgi:hypothetical protein